MTNPTDQEKKDIIVQTITILALQHGITRLGFRKAINAVLSLSNIVGLGLSPDGIELHKLARRSQVHLRRSVKRIQN